MYIESTIKTRALGVIPVVYEIVWAENKQYWTLPGEAIEERETVEEAVTREVKEESNMKVLKQVLLGVQDVFEGENVVFQTRSFCIVEPICRLG